MKTKVHQKVEQYLIADQQMLVIEPNAQEHVPVEIISHSQLHNHSKSLKRKTKGYLSSEEVLLTKKRKTTLGSAIQTNNPMGMIWDSQNYSCSYDSLFTILGDIWVYNPTKWTRKFNLMSSYAKKLGSGFEKVVLKEINLEDARNSVRHLLHYRSPIAFPDGTLGVDIGDLLLYMFTEKSIGKIIYNCEHCGVRRTSASKITSLFSITQQRLSIIQEYLDATAKKTKKCTCGHDATKIYKYNSSVDFQAISLPPGSQEIKISKSITLCTDTNPVILPIRGVIYYGSGHFVSRIISPTGEVWYHDGIETKRQCIREGYLVDYTENNLRFKGTKICVGVIYAL